MTALSSYSLGKVSVANGDTVIVGSDGADWSNGNAEAGDVIIVDGLWAVEINDVSDGTHLALWVPWSAGDKAAVDYVIIQKSPSRFDGTNAMADVLRMIAYLKIKGLFLVVGPNDAGPDRTLGEEDQFALQPATGRQWQKTGGEWVFKGVFKGINPRGEWDAEIDYGIADAVSKDGRSYLAIADNTNQAPPNATYWMVLADKGETGPAPWSPPAPWATATAFAVGPPASVVTQGGETYVCLVPHTSGTFATDLATGKWIKVAQKGENAEVPDEFRRNSLLDRIYQAKVYGGARNGINTQAVGFVAATDINAGASSNASVNLTSGYVSPTTSTGPLSNVASTTLTNNVTGQGGVQFRVLASPSILANVSGDEIRVTLTPPTTGNSTNISSCWIGHQGVSAPNFDGNQVRVTFSGGSSSTVLAAGGSPVVSDVVSFPAGFDHTKPLIISFETTGTSDARTGASTGFSFYSKVGSGESGNTTVSGYGASAANSGAWVTSVDVGTASFDSMTAVTPSQTVASTVSNGRLLLEYDNASSPTLNTDLLGYVSCDGGSHWTQVALSAAGLGQSGRFVAESPDTAVANTGTAICAKVGTANGKNVQVYGAALTVH